MWEYQWITNKVELTEELNDTLYDESQGIIDIAVKLFALVQGRAIETGAESITPTLIRKVAKEDLKLVQPMLKALRTGNLTKLEEYGDIMPMDIADYLQQQQSKVDLKATIQKKKEVLANRRKHAQNSKLEKLILALMNVGIKVELAEEAALKVLKENPELSESMVLVNALQYLQQKEQQQSKTPNTKTNTNKLKVIIDKGKKEKQSVYESLKISGYILNPFDEFAI